MIIDLLHEDGHKAFVVGGCVRDAIMGSTPDDWDITTSARPEQIHKTMKDADVVCIDTGLAHGTVTVVFDGEHFEVTTFRSDGEYSDGRHPDSVEFLDDVAGDLARRDFTVNAMAYDPETGLIDLFGGQEDLDAKVLRAVGDPYERFREDALRIVRGLRFASKLGFRIEHKTSNAIHDLKHLLDDVAVERIWIEFSGLLCGGRAVQVLREYSDVVFQIIPELAPTFEFDQHNPFHLFDVWEHTLHALEAAPEDMDAASRLAVLLHDVGKPHCFTMGDDGKGHMYGHEKVGEPIADAVCRRLKLSNADRKKVTHLVRWHMFSIPDTERAMRRFLAKHGEQGAQDLFAIRRCDKFGIGRVQPPDNSMSIAFSKAEALMEEQLAAEPVFGLKDLAINGSDLMKLGYEQGPDIGKALHILLDAVIDCEVANERDALIAYLDGIDTDASAR